MFGSWLQKATSTKQASHVSDFGCLWQEFSVWQVFVHLASIQSSPYFGALSCGGCQGP
jgi:hypothetical protein